MNGGDFRNRLRDAIANLLPVYDRSPDHELSLIELGPRVMRERNTR